VTFGRVVVFGTSLSDPGNAFVLTGQSIAPPYDTPEELDRFLIPRAPYVKGGYHFSNGTTWIEQFARGVGLAENARPAFRTSSTAATNYAVGGARARDNGINVNLSDQVNAFLDDFGGVAPSDALYVIEMGANDVRDALAAGTDGGAIIAAALASIGKNVLDLSAAGAKEFLVLNVPNVGLTPAIRTLDSLTPGAARLAEGFTQLFNWGLDKLLRSAARLPGIEIARMDLYQKVNALVANPRAFGLSEVEAACVTLADLPPFSCRTPDRFLFWDGIHPTKAVHAIFALEAAFVLAE
jgi:outer membrane lipase/esterase